MAIENFVALLSGLVTHLAFFNRGEHHLQPQRYVMSFLLCYILLIVEAIKLGGHDVRSATLSASVLAAWYMCGLYASLCAFRLFFSPLSRFPGPVGARLSDFWLSLRLRKLDLFRRILDFHEQYGDFVRIGSNTLSIRHPDAIVAVYGLGSKCRKADWYDTFLPAYSIQTMRRRDVHDDRRRVWSPAFSDQAIRGYETRIRRYQDRLVERLQAFGSEPVNVTKWFYYYAFDVMGDLTYNRSFDMLHSSEEHWVFHLMTEGPRVFGLMLPCWFFRFLVAAVPGLAKDWFRVLRYSRTQTEVRRKESPEVPDIMSYILQSYPKDATLSEEDEHLVIGDSQTAISAGSDTTSLTLTYLFYELGKHPEHITRIREEVEQASANGAPPTHQELQALPHLNGVINETLRLHPVVPTALQRLTPPEGITIGATFVPGNTVVWCPQYSIARNEAAYAQARDFIPERWTTRPELVRASGAYAPFSLGTFGCIGKSLALMNLRTTVARLLREFDVSIAPDEDCAGIEEDTKEHFLLEPGPLRMVLRKR